MTARRIVVTGSAGGIGRTVAERLRAGGVTVTGVDLHDAEELIDLAEPAGRAAGLARLAHGVAGGLDGLVVCAGVGAHVTPPEAIVRVNLHGALATLDALLPALVGGSDPSVVVVGSNSAGLLPSDDPLTAAFLDGDESGGIAAAAAAPGPHVYAAAKRALAISVRRRAPEFAAAGVRVNVVAPGPVRTALLEGSLADPVQGAAVRAFPVPLDRWAAPHEIADVIGLLLSPAASFVHGAIWYVDGGTDALVRPDTV